MISKTEIKRNIKKSYLKFKWVISIFFIPFTKSSEPIENEALSEEELRNPLILVPHADDEWIGCSQILKNASEKTIYYFNFLGNNYSKENELTRLHELKNLQKQIRFNLQVSQKQEDYKDLEKLIIENDFSSIFIPSPIDWHAEHILTNKIFLNLFPNIENQKIPFYFYHVSVPLSRQMEKKHLPMNRKDVKEKEDAFIKHYPSQRNLPIERFTLQNRLSAIGSGHFAIETYAKISFTTWGKLLQFIDLYYEEYFLPLKHIIDFPIKIRKAADATFETFLSTFEFKTQNSED